MYSPKWHFNNPLKYLKLSGLAVLLFITACSHSTDPSDVEDKFVLSDTMLASTTMEEATMAPVTGELKLFGKIAADNGRQADVYPAVGGNVLKVNAELGDKVNRGQVLAIIRSAEVAGYEEQRQDAQNALAVALKNNQVAQDLSVGKLNNDRDVLEAETQLKSARARVERSNQNFSIYNLGKGAIYNVTAPLSGFVIDRNISENMQLRSDNTEPIFKIAQIDVVWVLANVNESDIGKVSLGMQAEVRTLSYPDRVFTGTVDKIFNVLDDNTNSMKLRIVISNSDLALKPEMSATVSLKMEEKRSMLSVPSSAIIFDKNKNWVMVYHTKDSIDTRQVEVYRKSGDLTYISHGLEVGEKVVTKNQLLIYDALND